MVEGSILVPIRIPYIPYDHIDRYSDTFSVYTGGHSILTDTQSYSWNKTSSNTKHTLHDKHYTHTDVPGW